MMDMFQSKAALNHNVDEQRGVEGIRFCGYHVIACSENASLPKDLKILRNTSTFPFVILPQLQNIDIDRAGNDKLLGRDTYNMRSQRLSVNQPKAISIALFVTYLQV